MKILRLEPATFIPIPLKTSIVHPICHIRVSYRHSQTIFTTTKYLNTRKGLIDETFVFHFRIVAKVDQEPKLFAGRFQIIDYLGTMLVA